MSSENSADSPVTLTSYPSDGAAFSTAVKMSSADAAGYCDQIWFEPSTAVFRTSRTRCSLSSMIADLTLPLVNWVIATDVGSAV